VSAETHPAWMESAKRMKEPAQPTLHASQGALPEPKLQPSGDSRREKGEPQKACPRRNLMDSCPHTILKLDRAGRVRALAHRGPSLRISGCWESEASPPAQAPRQSFARPGGRHSQLVCQPSHAPMGCIGRSCLQRRARNLPRCPRGESDGRDEAGRTGECRLSGNLTHRNLGLKAQGKALLGVRVGALETPNENPGREMQIS
jgi:hypothetical protein